MATEKLNEIREVYAQVNKTAKEPEKSGLL
jgi:hypothetical protein